MGEAAVKTRIFKAEHMGRVDQHNRALPWGHELRITPQGREIFRVIIGFVAQGKLFPSYERIAELANCCVDSVWRAIARLRKAGFLSWTNEWRRDHDRGKWIKTTNTYSLETPTKTEFAGATPARVIEPATPASYPTKEGGDLTVFDRFLAKRQADVHATAAKRTAQCPKHQARMNPARVEASENTSTAVDSSTSAWPRLGD
jgi:hypothetical protein